MPTYDYKCENCGSAFEFFQSMKDEPMTLCPQCGHNTLKKMVSMPAGLIFKGSGFYQTDYAKKSSSSTDKTDKKVTTTTSKTEKKPEVKEKKTTEKKKD
ncbi:MAG: zinc ribbon domain-containing protein [Candidatus Kapaibacterium sp.]